MTPTQLIGFQLGQFDKSARIRIWLLLVQILVGVPGALSVLVQDSTILYYLAIVGASGVLLWWWLSSAYQKSRTAAQSARRASLLLGAFSHTISGYELENLRSRFTITDEEAEKFANKDYYASNKAAGVERLREMLEESAFFTAELQKRSASVMLGVFLAFTVVFVGISLVAGLDFDREQSIVFVRFFLALLVIFLSSDVWGAFVRHRSCAEEVKSIRARLKVASEPNTSMANVLLIMTDYDSAIEGAPEVVPFVFEISKDTLNKRWKDYISH